VLVNPATESLTAREIKLALRDWKESYPLIVAITSKTDGPNKTAWPLGYCVSKFALQVPPDRNYIVSLKHSDGTAETYLDAQRRYLRMTVGSDPRQWTHQLVQVEISSPPPLGDIAILKSNLVSKPVAEGKKIFIKTNPDGPPTCWSFEETGPSPEPFLIDSKAYWVLPVDQSILPGHGGDKSIGGIFSEPMTDLVSAVFAMGRLDKDRKAVPEPLSMPSFQATEAQKN
jgi:hypothetical protein